MSRSALLALVLLLGWLLTGAAHAQTALHQVYLPIVRSAPLRVAFAGRSDSQSPYQIYTANADGSELTRLTDPAQGENREPAWSPDGRQIAFVSFREGRGGLLYQMSADGGGQERFGGREVWANSYLRWSPDGTHISYLFSWRALSLLYILDLSGSQVFNLGYAPAGLSWSPDSQRIAYISSSLNILSSRLDQTDPITLTNTPERYENGVAWSPDGARLAFTADTNLYVIAKDGSNEHLLMSEPEATSIGEPSWSPDGRLIASTVRRSDNSVTILVVCADGTGKYELPTGLQSISELSWKPR
jgi:TolB protein